MSKKLNKWLFKKDTKGKIRKWRVNAKNGEYWTEGGLDEPDGAITVTKATPCFGKNIGKANETSPEDQAIKEAEARYDKKVKEGYCEDRSKVDKVFKPPMLAQKFSDRYQKGKINFPIAGEVKLNGVRALYRERGKMVSRKNERFHTIPHIVSELDHFFPEGIHLDGELFNQESRENLNRITKLVSVARTKPSADDLSESEKLVQYHVYDAYNFRDELTRKKITPETPFIERRKAFLDLMSRRSMSMGKPKYIFPVRHKLLHTINDVFDMLDKLVEEKQEGLILREINGTYEHKRSFNLLKLKNFEEDEFIVSKVEQGKGDWTGHVKRVICQLHGEMLKTARKHDPKHSGFFASNIEGNREYLRSLWKNPGNIVGKKVTVKYQNLSEYGIPQIPWVVAVRDYE